MVRMPGWLIIPCGHLTVKPGAPVLQRLRYSVAHEFAVKIPPGKRDSRDEIAGAAIPVNAPRESEIHEFCSACIRA
jgi:hypothetical protein